MDALVHARRLHDAAIERDIAGQHRDAAILREGVSVVADDACRAIRIEIVPATVLAEGDLGGHPAGGRAEEALHPLGRVAGNVVALNGLAHGGRVDRRHIPVNEPGPLQLAQNGHDAARAMHVLHMHIRHRRRDLAEHRHLAGQAVDIRHVEGHLALIGGSEQVKHRIGRAAHGDVERHRVLEGLEIRDVARQHALVVLLVIATGEIDDQVARLHKEALAVRMGRQHRAIARQREAQRLGEAVHGIGGEHARAGAAGRASRALDGLDLCVAIFVVGGGDHRVDEIDGAGLALVDIFAGLHGPAGHEDHGDVEAHGCHQHARGDLVAIGDADDGVGAMSVAHVFDGISDDLAGGQAVEHAVMAHGDPVINRDGVELLGDAARLLDLARDELAEILQMHVARHELGEGIGHRDDRLAEIPVLHARGAPEPARASHVAAVGGGSGAIMGHWEDP